MAGKLQGKVAVVTGGNSGIGLATARLFVEEGAQVFITGRRQHELDDAVEALGPNAIGVQGDVGNLDDLDRLYEAVREKAGRIDVLFANAGKAEFTALAEVTEDHFESIFRTNVKGTLFTVQKALPLLSQGASIVLNASIVSSKGIPGFTVYSATKAAIRSFARTWTSELKDKAIRVNVVSPGTVVTPGYKNSLKLTDQEIKHMEDEASRTAPLGRPGTTEEIASSVLFLASSDSSYVTGVELFVDGGVTQV